MFNPGNMEKMMKQMGMDMEEIDAKRVVVDLGDEEIVFERPELNKINVKGQEMFQLQGDHTRQTKASGPSDDDVELVAQRAGVSEDKARDALEEHEDIADAVMALQE
ncbi:MAG: nascent polypeptide-associated complex protein [Candidatus Nanohaloarchaeota archaeon QJJ-5]|nr:nascent polypeptide-associated complex protein [Candidatus Nanohaloarchaeota archaeon QJJ-5]